MVERVVIQTPPTGPDAPTSVPYTPPDTPPAPEAPPAPPAPPADDRPEWLPEKFSTPADLAKAYKELEAKLGKPTAPETPPATPETPPATPEVTTETILNSYQEGLSEMVRAQLAGTAPDAEKVKALDSIDKSFVDKYVAGQVALVQQTQVALYETVGGKDSYEAMMRWGVANLNDGEKAAFDAALDRGEHHARMAVEALSARYTKANGKPAALVTGATNAGQSRDTYESIAQMQVDMSDPRYRNDPAFRARVEQKLLRSSIL